MDAWDWITLISGLAACYISLYTIVQRFRDRDEHNWAAAFTILAILLTPFAVFALVLGVLATIGLLV